MSSTELFEAASSSRILNECPSLKEVHDSQALQGSMSSLKLKQLIVFAKIRAVVVFPTPLDPKTKKLAPNDRF